MRRSNREIEENDESLSAVDKEPVSKSQKKRDSEKIRLMCVRLADLTPNQLSKLKLSAELLEAILFVRKIGKKNEAYRRQILFIAKQVRELDHKQILHDLDHLHKMHHQKTP